MNEIMLIMILWNLATSSRFPLSQIKKEGIREPNGMKKKVQNRMVWSGTQVLAAETSLDLDQ